MHDNDYCKFKIAKYLNIPVPIVPGYLKDLLGIFCIFKNPRAFEFTNMISKKYIIAKAVIVVTAFCFIASCHRTSSHQEMISILQRLNKKNYDIANPFRPEAKLAHYDSLLSMPGNSTNAFSLLAKAPLLLQDGQE